MSKTTAAHRKSRTKVLPPPSPPVSPRAAAGNSGISNSEPIFYRIAFKPAAPIFQKQQNVTFRALLSRRVAIGHGDESPAIFPIAPRVNPNLAANGDDWLADSIPSDFAVHENKLYFMATDGSHGYELWVDTGSGAPQMVADIYSGTYGSNGSGLRAINGGLFLAADSGAGYGQELYRLIPSPVVDNDSDGMPDNWETEHGLNPALNDAAGDRDGDGVSNVTEFTAGTDPASPPSTFRAELDGTFRLTWPSVPGKTYLVSANTGIGWVPFQTVSAAPAPGDHTVLKLTPPASGTLLFRVGVSAD